MKTSKAITKTVCYREKLTLPYWCLALGVIFSSIILAEIRIAIPDIPTWLIFLFLVVIFSFVTLLVNNTEIMITNHDSTGIEVYVRKACISSGAVLKAVEVPSSVKSTTMGRQLDPSAYVVHKAWIGPMILLILDDPYDPTPYWLVSTRYPKKLLAAICNSTLR